MTRFRVVLEYDGSEFQGWQLQRSVRTVQGVLEEALAKITASSVRVTGAGRTDAGVHALGQVAHFDAQTRLRPLELRAALNAGLPKDVAALQVLAAAPDFHARYHALGKRYAYRILNRPTPAPARRRFVWHLRRPLALQAMEQAARALLGERDFAAFRGSPGGAPTDQNTVRRLDLLEVERREDELWIVAEAPSFLRYMVRNLVGTLVEVGLGKRSPDDPARVLASRDRKLAGATAPAQGLVLEAIRYPDDPQSD